MDRVGTEGFGGPGRGVLPRTGRPESGERRGVEIETRKD